MKVSLRKVADLYSAGMSQPQIGKLVGCSGRTISTWLRLAGVEAREHTAARHCWCGAEVEKRVIKSNDGRRSSYAGTLCAQHRRERNAQVQREIRAATVRFPNRPPGRPRKVA